MENKKLELIPILVALVVKMAKRDTSSPDPKNLRSGWETDMLFTQDIDQVVVGAGQYVVYAEIARFLEAELRDPGLEEPRALAMLGVIRGERLQPINPTRAGFLIGYCEDTMLFIKDLPDGTRKDRCLSLFNYHEGELLGVFGRFEEAAKRQQKAAQTAETTGDMKTASISWFRAADFNLKNALATGATNDQVNNAFLALDHRHSKLVMAVFGESDEDQWQANGAYEMAMACVWIGQERSVTRWSEWMAKNAAACAKLGHDYKIGAKMLHAADMDRNDEPGAEDALRGMSHLDVYPEIPATARLMLFRRLLKAGKFDEAARMDFLGDGVSHIRAAAMRELAEATKK